MIPDVRRPLYRAAGSAVSGLAHVFQTLFFLCSAIDNLLDAGAELLHAKADMDDPDILEALEEAPNGDIEE